MLGKQDLYSSPEISSSAPLQAESTWWICFPAPKGKEKSRKIPSSASALRAHRAGTAQLTLQTQSSASMGAGGVGSWHSHRTGPSLLSCLLKNPALPGSRTCLRVIFSLLRAAPQAQRAPGFPTALWQCPVPTGGRSCWNWCSQDGDEGKAPSLLFQHQFCSFLPLF